MRFLSSLMLILLAVGLQACDGAIREPQKAIEVSVNVPDLIGKSRDVVDAALGKPQCPPKNACIYGDRLEVYFAEGKAGNFTLPYVDDLRVYGMEVGEPSFANVGVKRWEVDLNGTPVEVSAFEGDYVYVKSVEP